MASFAYTAIDRQGRRTTGVIPAESRAAAMDAVASQGLSPISIAEAAAKNSGFSLKLGGGTKVPAKAVENFTRELANLLAAGLSLSRALALLKRESSNAAAKNAWTKIHDSVVGGEPLAESLAKFPQAFSSVYIAMVRAGETGGFLHVVLQQISDFRQREQDLKGKVKAAMIYPIALASVATGVLIFLMTFFIPKFSAIFEQFGSKLPALTQVVVAISGFLISYGLFIAIGLAVGVYFLRKWMATLAGKRAIERLVLRTPALGLVVARFALVRFSRMLGTLVGSGVPLVAALKVAKEAIGNQTLSDAVASAIDQVQRGTPLSKALSSNTQLFPASVIETIAVAEETGRVDKELLRLSIAYEGDLDRNLRTFVALAEPLLLVIMAAIIGTVVVAMLLPVFTLQDMIN
ncbi:MAG TPA: type II secretion system F family protein [Tepidisphaeraceae bacterium]|jgi:type II secretory pathway component PulF